MKIIISQQVKIEGDRFPHNWSKVYNSVVIPSVGDSIEDSIWKDPLEYKVEKVLIDYGKDTC